MKDRSALSRLGRIEYIGFDVSPEEEASFLHHYQFAKLRLEECAPCTGYELCRAKGLGQFILRIEWDASTAAWPAGQTPEVVHRFLLALKGGLKAMTWHVAYEPVGGLGPYTPLAQEVFHFDAQHN